MIRLATFVVGTLLLCGLSTIAGDPLWTPWSSLVAAVAAYLTAPRVFAVWVGHGKVTLLSILLWYIGAALPFDVAQLYYTGTWRLGWAASNAAARHAAGLTQDQVTRALGVSSALGLQTVVEVLG